MKKISEFLSNSLDNITALEEVKGYRAIKGVLPTIPQSDSTPNDDWLIKRHTALRTKTQSDPDHPTRYRPCP